MSLFSSWNVGERTCYYDLLMTNDINFFRQSIPLVMNLKEGKPVNLAISALHRPKNSIF